LLKSHVAVPPGHLHFPPAREGLHNPRPSES
jgi:hypothetical protein